MPPGFPTGQPRLSPGQGAAPRYLTPLGLLVLLLVLAAQHLENLYSNYAIFHMQDLVEHFAYIDRGFPWVVGTDLAGKTIINSSPLFYWLHLPARLADNPVLGVYLLYLALELLGIAAWLTWGLRRRLDPALVWTGAFLLVGLKGESWGVAENMVMAAHFAVPLFIVLATTLEKPRLGALALAGGLLGLGAQLHLLLLLVVPVLLLFMLIQRLPLRKVAPGLLLGFALVSLLPLVAALFQFSTGHASYQKEGLAWGPFFLALSYSAGSLRPEIIPWDLASVLGTGLILVRWMRGAPPPAGHLLAVLWAWGGAFITFLALGFAYQWGEADFRYGIMLPARAYLGGVFLLFAVEQLNRWLSRRGRRLAAGAAALLAGLVGTAAVGWSAMERVSRERRHGQEVVGQGVAGDECRALEWDRRVRFQYQFYETFMEVADPVRVRAEQRRIPSPVGPYLEALIYFHDASGLYLEQSHTFDEAEDNRPRPTGAILVAPRTRQFLDIQAAGARSIGGGLIFPGCRVAHVERGEQDADYSVSRLPRDADEVWLVVIISRWVQVAVPPFALTRDGQTIRPVHSFACQELEPGKQPHSWALYRLSAADARADSLTISLLGPGAEQTSGPLTVEAIILPGRR